MITLSDISLQSLIAIPNQEFKTVRGPIAQNQTGRLIAENGEYRLYYVSGFTGELANQTEILTPSSGFLITKTAYNQNGNKRAAVQPLAFYIVDGKYSETSEQFKQNVVLSYNNTIEGQEAETTEGVERTQSLNDRGETVREQREREEREAAEAEEQRLKDQRTAIYETEIIRDESKTLTLEGASISSVINLRIIQITDGTVANPIVTYRVEQYSKTAKIGDGVEFSQDAQTQDEAEFIFDNRLKEFEDDYYARAEAEKARLLENETQFETKEEVNVFFQKEGFTLEELFYEEGYFYNAQLRAGNFDDAITFSNGGNTLNIVDFDTPRITTSGISENKSGAVKFRVAPNMKLSFRISFNTARDFIDEAAEGVDVTRISSDEFDFTMYGGDQLAIDIDNERSDIFPFVITVKGRKWLSLEEVDTDITLDLISVERLYFNAKTESGQFYIRGPNAGTLNTVFPNEVVEYPSQIVNFREEPLVSNLALNSKVSREINENPEFGEAMKGVNTRDIRIPSFTAEGSFVDPREVGGDFVDAVEDAGSAVAEGASNVVGSFFSRFGIYILGGLVVIGIFIYINARARSVGSKAVGAE
mgnify:CR=1 FL=1